MVETGENASPSAPCETLSTPGLVREAAERTRDARLLAIDVWAEGSEKGRAELVAVGLGAEVGAACYVPFGSRADAEGLLRELCPILEPGGPPKAFHDAKRDLVVLGWRGMQIEAPAFDTLIAAFLLDGRAYDLEDLAASRLDASPELRAVGEGNAEGSCASVWAVLRLAEILEGELEERGQLGYLREMELPLVPVLADMELAGIAVDTAVLDDLSGRLAERLRGIEAEMAEVVGHEVNPRSPRRLGELLYEELGLQGSRRTSSGRYSTDALALEALAGQHPVVEKIVEHRRLSRLKDAYADTLPALVNPRTGRVHTSFSQVSASSGRLVTREPNLQNIPVRTEIGREIRRAFVADGAGLRLTEPTVLLSVDYSQIELRVLAHVADEERLREAFRRGDDVHALTAARLYGVSPDEVTAGMRRVGKMLNYGVIYGMTGYRLALEAGIDRKEATEFVRLHGAQYPAVREYFERTLEEAEERGYVETPFGRRRYVPELSSRSRPRREAARRAAENMPNQGMVAEIIKRAMISVHARLRENGSKARMLLQVHDELIFEVPEGELEETAEVAAREMVGAVDLSVPLEVEAKYGPSWGEMRPL